MKKYLPVFIGIAIAIATPRMFPEMSTGQFILGLVLFGVVAFGAIIFLAKRNMARSDDQKGDNG
jgi:hypothetical protein